MKFEIKLKVFGRAHELTWSDRLPDKVMGNQAILRWLKSQAKTYRLRGITVGPIPAHIPPDVWDDPYSFLGFCKRYNQEENPGTELEVISEIPPLGDAPPDAVY